MVVITVLDQTDIILIVRVVIYCRCPCKMSPIRLVQGYGGTNVVVVLLTSSLMIIGSAEVPI